MRAILYLSSSATLIILFIYTIITIHKLTVINHSFNFLSIANGMHRVVRKHHYICLLSWLYGTYIISIPRAVAPLLDAILITSSGAMPASARISSSWCKLAPGTKSKFGISVPDNIVTPLSKSILDNCITLGQRY